MTNGVIQYCIAPFCVWPMGRSGPWQRRAGSQHGRSMIWQRPRAASWPTVRAGSSRAGEQADRQAGGSGQGRFGEFGVNRFVFVPCLRHSTCLHRTKPLGGTPRAEIQRGSRLSRLPPKTGWLARYEHPNRFPQSPHSGPPADPA